MTADGLESDNFSSTIEGVRPVLIADDFFIAQFGDVLGHILSGLNSEGCPAALLYPPKANIELFAAPSTTRFAYPYFNLPFCGRYNRKLLYTNLAKLKPTIVHSLSGTTEKLADKIADNFKIKYVANALYVDKLPCITSRCSNVIAVCRSVYDALNKHRRFYNKNCNINFSTFVEEDISCFKSSSRLTSITAITMFENYSVFEPLLNAIRHLAIDGYEFVFLIIGTGKHEKKVRMLVRQLGLSHIVNIVPFIQPLRTIFAEADIHLHFEPTNWFPSYLLEALSVGTAVAACRGGADDLIIKDQTAVVFDNKEELSIYSAISQLFDRREFSRQIARNAQEHIRKNYSVSIMIEELMKAYHTK